jgi:molybdopterin adenylyltransferase
MASNALPTRSVSRLGTESLAGEWEEIDAGSSVPNVIGDAKILTVSESVSQGTREDRSGDELARSLSSHGFVVIERRVVPDGVETVAAALVELSTAFSGVLITTGGTGSSPTDLTPEATRSVIDRMAPGLAEAMRAVSPLGRLSRGVAGTLGQCLILNVPGSPRGAVESFEAIHDVVGHALDLLSGHQPH